jgi:2-polyprenyl-6-methoxyphenol hydroxylase-like FAD-dependent oxidoreductase
VSANDQTSVVIAGAGPVGLGLACELGLRGIDCLLVEKRDGSVTVPKQSMVSARNMEFCRRRGVAAAVRNAVWGDALPADPAGMVERMRGATAPLHAHGRSAALAVAEQR